MRIPRRPHGHFELSYPDARAPRTMRRELSTILEQDHLRTVIASTVTMTEITSTSPTRTPSDGFDALPNGLFIALFAMAVPRVLEFPLLRPFLLIHPPVPL